MAFQVGVRTQKTGWAVSKEVIFYGVLIGYTLITTIPFVWSILTSFKTLPESARQTPTGLPLHWTLDAWTGPYGVLSAGSFPRWFLNSIIVALLVGFGNLFFDSLAGYAFARLRFPGRNILFFMVLGTMMVPAAMTLLPLYIILVKMPGGTWIDTYQGLTVPFMVSAFGIFLMRQFFMSLPVELEEAARVDGLGRFGIYWRIALPLSRPALATLGILQFQGNWDSYLMPSFIASSDSMLTLPVGLQHYSFQFTTFWPQVMAGSMIVIIPILIMYIFAQRFFIEGITSSGVKG
jgi:multiple sugar transport system permease protein